MTQATVYINHSPHQCSKRIDFLVQLDGKDDEIDCKKFEIPFPLLLPDSEAPHARTFEMPTSCS